MSNIWDTTDILLDVGTNQLATEVIQFCAGLLFKHFKAQGVTADIYEGKLRETAIVPFNCIYCIG